MKTMLSMTRSISSPSCVNPTTTKHLSRTRNLMLPSKTWVVKKRPLLSLNPPKLKLLLASLVKHLQSRPLRLKPQLRPSQKPPLPRRDRPLQKVKMLVKSQLLKSETERLAVKRRVRFERNQKVVKQALNCLFLSREKWIVLVLNLLLTVTNSAGCIYQL